MNKTLEFIGSTTGYKYKATDIGNELYEIVGENGITVNLKEEDVARHIGDGTWQLVDNVNHPSHYQGKFEVIDIIEQATEDLNGFEAYCIGNVIKYVMRHKKKGGVTDLKKAKWYLDKVIDNA